MRIALCDDDPLLLSLVEEVLSSGGHDIIGVADTSVGGVQLVLHGRPDVVVVDPAVGCNSDFDVIATAGEVGAATVVFSRTPDQVLARSYDSPPIVVAKPDLEALGEVLSRLSATEAGAVAVIERRARPWRDAAGPPPTGARDAAAFFTAVNEAVPGDALLAIALPSHELSDRAAAAVTAEVRAGDRVHLASWAVVAFVPGDGSAAIPPISERVRSVLGDDATITSVVVEPQESGADAFGRLRAATPRP